MRKTIFSIIILVLLTNNAFSNNSYTNTTTYTQSPIKVNCNNPDTAANPETITDVSGVKYIPDTIIVNGASASSTMGCTSSLYFGGLLDSLYTNKNITKVCPNSGYVSELICYDLSNNIKTCTINGAGWDKYKLRCKARFDETLVELNSANLGNKTLIADGQDTNIEIAFPLTAIEPYIDYIDFSFIITDNTSINWLDKNKNSIVSSAVSIVGTNNSGGNFVGDERTVTYRLTNGGNLDTMKSGDKFNFIYKFYNPTEIASDIFPATADGFIFKTISYDIEFTDGGSITGYYVEDSVSQKNIGGINDPTTVTVRLTPLIEIVNTGVFTSSGFIEGTTQTGTINLINNNTSVSLTNTGLYLSITGSTNHTDEKDYFTGTGEIDFDGNKRDIDKETLTNKFISTFEYGVDYILETLFTLIDSAGGHLDDIQYIRAREFIQYTVGGKVVTYIAGVLNQNKDQNFETLKIYGRTNIDSKKQKDLLTDQDAIDIQNLSGNITKASLKRDIRKRAINAIKFVETTNITTPIDNITTDSWNGTNGGKVLGNILYYEFSNGTNLSSPDGINAVIGNGDSTITDLSITGKKTLIVRGGNIRITDNIINTNNGDILGLIALKDENGFGGKIYIDSDVDEIDVVIYSDKSIIGYNTSFTEGNPDSLPDPDNILLHEINRNINNTVLDNQLYIYGSVFSENTIGASRIDPPFCPFWTEVASINCNTIEAQKYDFNYLRTGLGISPNFVPLVGNNYPVVIKYNSAIQSSPPPLFGE